MNFSAAVFVKGVHKEVPYDIEKTSLAIALAGSLLAGSVAYAYEPADALPDLSGYPTRLLVDGLPVEGAAPLHTEDQVLLPLRAIAEGGETGLEGLGLGYRDKYIFRMALRCAGPEGRGWLERLRESSREEAMELLLQEFGIGKKVADCICLFALHHVDAFPVEADQQGGVRIFDNRPARIVRKGGYGLSVP